MVVRYLRVGFDNCLASRPMRFFRIRPEKVILDRGLLGGRNSGRGILIGGGALLCGGHAELRCGSRSNDGGHGAVGG